MRDSLSSSVLAAAFSVGIVVSAHAAAPFGSFDSPTDGTTGAQGAIAVTGWALDDTGVAKLELWRDPVSGDPPPAPNGKIFIGQATFVAGARPDVQAAHPQYPDADRAAWGYMLLTNLLPDAQASKPVGGRGTFKLYAYVTDLDGNVTLLPTRTFSCNNKVGANKPFGTIDTPAQGETVSGVINNYGWVLTPQPSMILANGSTIRLYIDGVPRNTATYDGPRTDIETLFPGYANTTNGHGPVGVFTIDTTTLMNGVHTIAWSVTDDAGHAEGIGSRYFTVTGGIATPTPTPSVALIVGATPVPVGSGDAAIRDRLTSLGYDVVVKWDFEAQTADANGRSLVVISPTAWEGNVGGKFTNVATPVLTSRHNMFDDMSLAATYGVLAGFNYLKIADPAHPMAAGLTGNVVVTSSAQDIDWGTPNAAGHCIALTPGNDCAIFAYEQRALMYAGVIAARRRVGFFMDTGTPTVATTDAWKLFDAAVVWLTEPNPSATIGGPYQAHVGQPMNVTSAGSFARKGTLVSFAWDFGDGGTATGPTAQHQYAATGSYTVTLTVTDSQGLTATASTTATITQNLPPDVTVTVSALFCHPSCTQTFTAHASDPEGDVVTFAWGGCAAGKTTTTVSCSASSTGIVTATVTGTTPWNGPVPAQASFTATNWAPTVHVFAQGASRQVLFVTGPPDPDFGLNNDDVVLSTHLNDLGYPASLIQDSNVATPDRAAQKAAGNALVLISNTARPSYVSTNFNAVTVPVLVNRMLTLGDMQLSQNNDVLPSEWQLDVVNDTHPIGAGLSLGPTGVLLSGWQLSFNHGTPAPAATVIAQATNGAASIFAYEKGAILVDGSVAPARRVGYFMGDLVPQVLNDKGLRLLDNAVTWAAVPTPPSCIGPCSVNFTATGADQDGDPLAYEWSGCAAGQVGSTAHCSLSTPGTYTATVTVTDGLGGTATASAQAVAQ